MDKKGSFNDILLMIDANIKHQQDWLDFPHKSMLVPIGKEHELFIRTKKF